MSISLNPKVVIVIVNYNSSKYLARCLAALKLQTAPIWRCIVVDNASTIAPISGTEDWLAGIHLIRLENNIGFAAANNLAVRSAEGADWIALLNPDAFPEADWLANLLSAAQQFPEYCSFASRMLCADNPGILDGAGDDYYTSGRVRRRGHGMPAEGRYLEFEEVFSPCAAAALYRKSVFDEVGGFDEDFFCYLEDIDLGFRLRLAGYRCLYVPTAVVHHIGSAITGRSSNFSVYYGHRNLVWTYVKNMPGIFFWLYLPQHLIINLAGLLLYILRGQGHIILRAKLDALRNIPKIVRNRTIIRKIRKISIWDLRKSFKIGTASPRSCHI